MKIKVLLNLSGAKELKTAGFGTGCIRRLQTPLNVLVLAEILTHRKFVQETVPLEAQNWWFNIHCHYLSWHDNIVWQESTTAKKLCLQILSKRLICTAGACSAEEAEKAAGRKDAAAWSRQGARLPMPVTRQQILLLLSPQVLLMKKNSATLTKNNFPTAGKDQPVLLLDDCLVWQTLHSTVNSQYVYRQHFFWLLSPACH